MQALFVYERLVLYIQRPCDWRQQVLADEEPPIGQEEQVTVGQLQVHKVNALTARCAHLTNTKQTHKQVNQKAI